MENLFKIEVYDKKFEGVFDKNVKLEKVLSGFRFIEGPAWNHIEKALYFNDIMGNAIYKYKDDKLEMFKKNSYLANGNTFNKNGELITCEHGTSRVTKIDKDGNYIVLADKYNGKELNSPNDVICSKSGKLYFTDPMPGRLERVGIPRAQELDFQGVFMIDGDELVLLDDDYILPNGLCFDNEEKMLFVNDSRRAMIYSYDLKEDGTVCNRREFAKLDESGLGCADGLKFNSDNLLFCSAPGGIQVFDIEGNMVGKIFTPEVAANFTWGGEDLKDIYMTATSSVYRLKSNIKGNQLF